MSDESERFRAFLKERGHKLTHQRQAILERILEIDVSASNELGDHATGTVSVALPR